VLSRNDRCDDEQCCSAHHAWHDVRAAYTHFLTATTLADISQRPLGPKQHYPLSGRRT
jgi:DNA-binding IscR family transcriptional regulator